MKFKQALLAVALAIGQPSCIHANRSFDQETTELDKQHQRCVKIYEQVRFRILDIMDQRNLNFNDLVNDYLVNEIDTYNIRYFHPQALDSYTLCAVISSPVHQIYEVLIENPEGRDVITY